MNKETESQEQYLFNQLNFEERKNIIELMKCITNLQQENNQLKEKLETIDKYKMLLDIISVPVMKMKIDDIEKLPNYFDLYNENKQLKDANNILTNKIGKYIEQRDEWVELLQKHKQQEDLYKRIIDKITELVTNYEEVEKIIGAGKPMFPLHKLQEIIYNIKEGE